VSRPVFVFAVVCGGLLLAWVLLEGSAVQRALLDHALVRTAAWLIGWVDPAAQVSAHAHELVSPALRLRVLRGCEGAELYALWIAAVVAVPAVWKRRLTGLLLGLALAWCLNQARVIALFYTARDALHYFPIAHGWLLPGALVLLMVLGFLRYVAWAQR
jgi:exosortase/archaeosortase family protein